MRYDDLPWFLRLAPAGADPLGDALGLGPMVGGVTIRAPGEEPAPATVVWFPRSFWAAARMRQAQPAPGPAEALDDA